LSIEAACTESNGKIIRSQSDAWIRRLCHSKSSADAVHQMLQEQRKQIERPVIGRRKKSELLSSGHRGRLNRFQG
jgi:arsenate reductase-like glutaredoxin family protein